jgi:hypothetical protein
MTSEFWAIIGVGVVVAGSHLSLHRDIAVLRDRTAKLEGRVDGLAGQVDLLIAVFVKPPQSAQ